MTPAIVSVSIKGKQMKAKPLPMFESLIQLVCTFLNIRIGADVVIVIKKKT